MVVEAPERRVEPVSRRVEVPQRPLITTARTMREAIGSRQPGLGVTPGSRTQVQKPFNVPGNWNVAFFDHFTALPIPSMWVRAGDPGGSGWTADPGNIFDYGSWEGDLSNVSVSDSVITMSVTPGSPKPHGYGLCTYTKASLGYGFYEVRMRVQTNGSWPAFWLYSPWNGATLDPPADGTEMDVAESEAWLSLATHVSQHVHWNGYGVNHQSADAPSGTTTDGGWHIYGMEWQAGFYKFWVDGNLVWTFTTAIGNPTLIPAPGMIMLLDNASQGSTTDSGTLEADWVGYWTGQAA